MIDERLSTNGKCILYYFIIQFVNWVLIHQQNANDDEAAHKSLTDSCINWSWPTRIRVDDKIRVLIVANLPEL